MMKFTMEDFLEGFESFTNYAKGMVEHNGKFYKQEDFAMAQSFMQDVE